MKIVEARLTGKKAVHLRIGLMLCASVLFLALDSTLGIVAGGVLLGLTLVIFYEVTARLSIGLGYLFGLTQVTATLGLFVFRSNLHGSPVITSFEVGLAIAAVLITVACLLVTAPITPYKRMN